MALIVAIDLIVVACLVGLTLTKGFERALPFFAFIAIILPGEARIELSGLFVLTATRLAIMTLAILCFAFGNRQPNSDRSDSLPLKYLLILYLGWCIVSTVNSVVFTTSMKTVLSNALDFYLVYYIFAKSVSSVETIHKVLTASVTALVICCVFGVVERFIGWRVIELFPMVTHRFTAGEGGVSLDTGRITSSFPHAILFANALALGIPWTFYLLGMAKTTSQKLYLWAGLLIMAWNIYKTMSRGPWLALFVSLLLMVLFSPGSIRKYLAVVFILTVATLIIRPGVRETLKNTYFETADPDSPRGSSYQYRYTLMRVGKETLARNPARAVWGFGPSSWFDLGLEGLDPDTGHTVKYDSCDSAWVEIMVEIGYVGLFLVAALLIKAAWFSLRGFSRVPKPANLLCLIFLINIVAYAFMMLSVSNFGWGQQSYMLWIILAMSMVYPHFVGIESSSRDDGVTASQAEGRPFAELAAL